MSVERVMRVPGIQEMDNPERLKYFRVIDQLRGFGINEELPLPQVGYYCICVLLWLVNFSRLSWLEISPAESRPCSRDLLDSRFPSHRTCVPALQRKLYFRGHQVRSLWWELPLCRAPLVWMMKSKKDIYLSLICKWMQMNSVEQSSHGCWMRYLLISPFRG